ncbi:MAG TPA: ABC transporter ATP-binding protein [Dehalococcoidia bacterium]|nr:ABC transporter ATP-binding protein [Dehalococcoidia bacterium]
MIGGRGMGMGRGGMGQRRGELVTSDEDLGRVFDWSLLQRLIPRLKPYRSRAIYGLIAMVVLQVTTIAQPYLPGLAFDKMDAGDGHGLAIVIGIYIVTGFVGWIATYQQSYQTTRVGQYVLFDLASQMFRHISKLSLSFFDRNETGRIMARVQNDVGVLQNFLGQGIIATVGSLFSVIGILAVMFLINWRLAALTSLSVPLFLICILVWQRFARRSFRRARATISVVNANLQENVSGVRVIQSMRREAVNSQRFEEANVANLAANLGAGRVSAVAGPIVEFTSALALMLVLFFGGKMVIDDEMTIGQLIAFTLYVDRFFDPIRMITQQYSQLQRSTIAAERIFEVLDTESDVREAPDAYELPRVEGRVVYEHVKFGYIPEINVFDDLNLNIRAGERVALVGQTGAGKTTIASLLMRFYDPDSGRILVDGHDIKNVTLHSLRSQTGIVLQEPVLFYGSIAHNIRYARPDATDAEVEAAARAVGLHETIARMGRGYETQVNERGVGLSIGQRQLISFARVLLADPRILILDEATASLDASSEMIVQEAIRRLAAGRTAIIIAHRLSTIRDADRILVLENGRVIEEGDHAALMAQRGAYFRLYTLGFRDTPGTSTA